MSNRSHEPVFSRSTHEVSGWTAVLAESPDSIWLYLIPPNSRLPARDCWLANTVAAEEQRELDHYRSRQLPPPAPPAIAADECVIRTPAACVWQLRWNEDGSAVAACCDGKVLGFSSSRRMAAHARHLANDCAWGQAWSQRAFAERFEGMA
jgi:hypothetical protein